MTRREKRSPSTKESIDLTANLPLSVTLRSALRLRASRWSIIGKMLLGAFSLVSSAVHAISFFNSRLPIKSPDAVYGDMPGEKGIIFGQNTLSQQGNVN